MRVLLLIQRYWPYEGGSEEVFRQTAERLVEAGHQVTVFTSDAWDIQYLWSGTGKQLERLHDEQGGVKIRRFPVRHWPGQELVSRYLAMLGSAEGRLPQKRALLTQYPAIRMPKLLRRIRSCPQFDLVVAGVLPYNIFLYAGWQIARRQKIPFVAWPMLHLGLGKVEAKHNLFADPQRLRLLRQADLLLVNTAAEIPALEQAGIPPRRIQLGGLGVDPEATWGGDGEAVRAKYRLSGPVVLQLSKQVVDKGSQHTIAAARLLWEAGYDFTLVLVGQTTDNFDRDWQAQPAWMWRRTLVLDYVDNQEKKDWLDAADVLVMPSKADSFGLVFLEAWLYRKPVVGATAGGIPCVIRDGEDGLLTQYGDPHMLAENLARLLAQPELRSRLGEAGYRRTLADWTWEKQFLRTKAALATVAPGL